ncbi:MAG TPA: PAS domain-containing protein [Archangium sp.]|uniref:PAS domain-containing protein n=1 Tax=Archangium sp. TaxID=1872627 RepID=UPI002E2F3243|nr:PAS domain-containing protein [Archangium sp.]HEX5753907.1 PAS domain-containing protein [Archangium sp.]
MSDTLDFQALFNHSPNPYMVLERELRYVAANEAYLRLTVSRLEELVGRSIFEAFPLIPRTPTTPTRGCCARRSSGSSPGGRRTSWRCSPTGCP